MVINEVGNQSARRETLPRNQSFTITTAPFRLITRTLFGEFLGLALKSRELCAA
jgi:hypothetical protein